MTTAGVYLPGVTIAVGGRPLAPAVAHRVTEVSVTQRTDPPGQFSFNLYDPELDLIAPAGGPITEGMVVDIGFGYSGKTTRLITGRITALAAEFPADGPPLVHVDGFDLLHDLARGTAYRVFPGSQPGSGMPDSQIVTRLARDVGLTPAVRSTPPRRTPRVQNHISDLAFARQLAALNGFSLWADGRTLHFEPERPPPGAAIRLARGQTLRSFTPRLSITGQVMAVEVRGWDPLQKQSFSQRSAVSGGSTLASAGREAIQRGSGGDSVLVIADAQVTSATEAKTMADRIVADLGRVLVTGTGSCAGQAELRAGSRLLLSGIGRFSGSYTVTEVTHTISTGGYLTSFTVNGGSDADSEPAGDSGEGLTYGALSAIVTDNADSRRRGQIEVRIPALDERARLWARLGTLMAGADRGTLFLPEVGDEVLVAFEQGDPGRPYVIGSLWNGRDQPPGSASDKSSVRLIRSRSGHEIRLDDTDRAEKIDITSSDKQHRITLDASAKKVTVHSEGTIRLEGDVIELQARSALTIKGKTVDIN